ncbi:class I SAM-dependent rRNA methyltransferase [Caulobacter sp. 17J65-9]|uniref:class I SAM-dependent rRNA methyltransferase n=1 Tax=Caulobacter sp. 17J65-9 TaxID=2709382 RepID=UPI0013C78FCF|nr:class I SAM-dependent rRNA methyltransferase [Caulobacter sp. 17J65-9]NEX92467.1 class I SAM-dependent rRNA methyltransferase [Caulobacter sp. 17J65-9]
MTASELPVVRFKPKAHQRAQRGHPWIYSNEVEMDAATKALPAGALVQVATSNGEVLDHGWFNPSTLISVRRLETGPVAPGADFFEARLRAAAELRQRLFEEPWWRWIHAEADGLPGLIVDRFGDTVVLQANTAGADRSLDQIVEAIGRVAPEVATIVARNDTASRGLEGLPQEVRVLKGDLEGAVRVRENGATYFADPLEGQKTGWFYDHRANRALVRQVAKGQSVLDLYAYAGAFAVQAALGGAERVVSVDRSERALEFAGRAAAANGVDGKIAFQRADCFSVLEAAEPGGFGLVVADPPAFAKSRKDLPQALKGYRKLARLAARAVAPGGFLFIASCSHAVDAANFQAEVARGVHEAGRRGRIVARGGADRDHPEHPHLPESAYLKSLLFALV